MRTSDIVKLLKATGFGAFTGLVDQATPSQLESGILQS
jgi:hypothetical protein